MTARGGQGRKTDSTAPTWSAAFLTGVAVPVGWLLLLSDAPASLVLSAGPAFTLGLMGVGILAAAIVGRFWVGVLLALINVACLVALALALDMPALPTPIATALVMIIASGSFAARGALFTKTLSSKAWLMGLFVVAGEASVLLIAALFPGVLPNWFLALLPAQWASVAIQTTVTGTAPFAAVPAVIALAGTASTTLLAARLWFRSWPYALMFNAWLGLSALVYFWPVPTAS